MDIGRLEPVPLREIWRHEAHGFTTWLAKNLDLIGAALRTQLSLVEREAKAGTFFADILAEDKNGDLVIIENQLETTNHDHLGKIITYMSNLEAKTAVWISNAPKPEHEKAVHWLNEMLPADSSIYLLRIEAYRIGDSSAAPLLTVIAGPTAVGKETGEKKKELAERHVLRQEFWGQLLEKAKNKTALHERISPSKENWVGAGAGKSGLEYTYVIRMEDAQVELYIDNGDEDLNNKIFDQFFSQKEKIEADFGGQLDWQRLDEKRACRVRYVIKTGGLNDKEKWEEIQGMMIDAMIRLERAFMPEIQMLKY